jgi:hypothetical protein
MSITNLNTTYNNLTIDGLVSIDANDISVNGQPIDPGSYVPYSGATSDIDLGTHTILSSTAPTSSSNLTNKNYVDVQDAIRVPYTGATANVDLGTYSISSSTAPSTSNNLTNKNYVDTQDALKVPYTGATSNVNLGAYTLTASTAKFTTITSATPSLALGVDASGNLNSFAVPTASNILPLDNTFTGTNTFNNNLTTGDGYTNTFGNAVYTGVNAITSGTPTTTGITAAAPTPLPTISFSVPTYTCTPSGSSTVASFWASGTFTANLRYFFTFTNATTTVYSASAQLTVCQANTANSAYVAISTAYPLPTTSTPKFSGYFTPNLNASYTGQIFFVLSNVKFTPFQWDSFSYGVGALTVQGNTTVSGIATINNVAITSATMTNASVTGNLTTNISNSYIPYSNSGVLANSIISQSGGTLTITQTTTTVPTMTLTSVAPDSAIDLNCTATSGRKYRVGSAGTGTGAGVGNFFIYDATAGQPRMVIDSSGKVGMGTIAPSGQLNIVSSSSDYTNSLVVNTAWPSITLDGSGTTGRSWSILNGAAGAGVGQGNLGIYDITGGAYRLSINSSGFVGMGVDVSTQKLMVQGNVVSRGASTGGTIGTTSGNFICLNSDDGYTYPTISTFNYQHDNQAILFDMYYSGNWYNSTGGFGWMIYKQGNNLVFFYMKSNGAGTVSSPQLVMTMNTSGAVSIPQQPYVLLYGGGGGSIPYNYGDIYGASAGKAGYFSVGQSVGMSNVFGNGWYQALGTFYAPQSGKYQINLTMYWNSFVAGTRWSIQHYNSSNTNISNRYCMIEAAGIGGDTIRQYSCMIYMSAGDYFFIRYSAGGGTSYAYFSGYEHSHMSIHMVS